jgi:hypothetical protein
MNEVKTNGVIEKAAAAASLSFLGIDVVPVAEKNTGNEKNLLTFVKGLV